MDTDLLQNLINSDLIWQILIALAMLLLFHSVPKETLDKLERRADETETPLDDMAIRVLRWLNANKDILPTLLPETGLPAPVAPPQAPAPDVPPFVADIPHEIVRIFGTTDSSLERIANGTRRVIHVPSNTSPHLENKNAAGVEYPYPSVNINPAYGVQFDIAYIAGVWGFTLMETLVNASAYKVRLEYSAQVTGDKKATISEWLWHELAIDGNITGANQGISNGVSYAEWDIRGTGLPMMMTPRIRCQWASASDESKISWQRLTITPVGVAS